MAAVSSRAERSPLMSAPALKARPQLASAVPGEQLLDRARQLVGGVPAEVAQRRAERGAVLDQQPVGRDLLDAAHEADQQDAPAPAKRGERGVEERAADGIEADVGALVLRERHHAL